MSKPFPQSTSRPADQAPAEEQCEVIEESDHPRHRRYKIQGELRKRLDRYLTGRLPGLSRSKLQKLINAGAVTVNADQPKSSTILRRGDVVDMDLPPPEIEQIPAEPIPLDVLYEDEHLIVLNKQAGLIVHPGRGNRTGTLVNALAYYFRDVSHNPLDALSTVGVAEFRPGIVHRLDKDTTGCIVVAKTDAAHYSLARSFEKRRVQKHYLALVHGEMSPPGDVIDAPIGRHTDVAEACAVRHAPPAREAVTIYRPREVFDGYSLVELELKTGRTHQIRVHLNYLGFPIVSDIIYGGCPLGVPELKAPPSLPAAQPYVPYARHKPEGLKIWKRIEERDDLLLHRPALHAARLEFPHPMTDQPLSITAPEPDDMGRALRVLRTHAREHK